MFKSKAISAQGCKIMIESARGAAEPATAITAAKPPVVADATPVANGSYVEITAAANSPDMVGQASITGSQVAATSYELEMLDFVGLPAAGASSLVPLTMTSGCEMKSFNGFDGQAGEIDVTTLCSDAKEYVPGLQDFGNFSFEVNLVPNDPFQIACNAARSAGAAKWFVLLLPDGVTQYLFKAFVRQFSIAGGVEAAVTGSVTLRVTGEPILYLGV